MHRSLPVRKFLLCAAKATFNVSRFLALPMSTLAETSVGDKSRNQRSAAASRRIVAPAKTEPRKGFVLMLHGWAQNALVMRNKTQGMAKKLNQAGYECIYLEAPHELPLTSTVEVDGQKVEITNGKRENARAWFLFNPDDPADASSSQSRVPMRYYGLQESLDIVESLLKELVQNNEDEKLPFVSILGFSQGSVLCHVLSRLTEAVPNRFGSIRAAILASGFAAEHVWSDSNGDDPDIVARVENMSDRVPIAIPSLHTIGEKDESVKPELGENLAKIFVNSVVYQHEKGHMIVQRAADCARVIRFLDDVLMNQP